jgi:hypothetical protein
MTTTCLFRLNSLLCLLCYAMLSRCRLLEADLDSTTNKNELLENGSWRMTRVAIPLCISSLPPSLLYFGFIQTLVSSVS